MAALDFPANPTNGQLYPAAPNAQYIYNATAGGPSVGAWESLPMESAKTVTADVPPADPKDGDQWFNTVDGTLYIYIVDVDGGQWVESQAPITANGYYSPNYIINGGFDIWQRGTSGFTSGYFADRWFINGANSGSRSTDAPTGFAFSANTTTTSNTYAGITQRIESLNTTSLVGKTITVSFWYKRTAATTGFLYVNLDAATAGADNYSTAATIESRLIATAPSTSWTRYSATFTNLSASVANGFSVSIFHTNGSTFAALGGLTAGVQLEEGSVATTFRRNANSIQGELAACQRYFQKSYKYDIAPGTNAAGGGQQGAKMIYVPATGNTVRMPLFFPVNMRIAPTMTQYNPETGTAGYWCYEGSGASNQFAAYNTFFSETGVLIYGVAAGFTGNIYIQYKAEAEI